MLKVHTTNGLTKDVELEDEDQYEAWLLELSDPRYQSEITGISVVHKGVTYSLPRPFDFRRVSFFAEPVLPDPSKKLKGGNRVFCYADDVKVSMMIHRGQRSVRVQVSKPGRRRFDPTTRGQGEKK